MKKLTTKEAAKFAGIGLSTLTRKVSEKKFPQPYKEGKNNYYDKDEVAKWKKGNWVYQVLPNSIEQPFDAMFEDFNLYDALDDDKNWLERRPRLKAFWDKYYISYVLIALAALIMFKLGA